MATQFTVYSSTDASAPTITGVAGSLTTALDAILVNGYGAKAAAGWSIAYTATNRRVYLQGAGSSGCYFRVRDDAGGTGGAKEAIIYGAEAMSDVNTVVSGRFPAVAQSALTDNGQIIRKSATADATARAWVAFADSRTIYLFVITGDTVNVYFNAFFGDSYSLVSSDTFRAVIGARSVENNVATTGFSDIASYSTSLYNMVAGSTAAYRQRNFSGVGGSTAIARCGGPWGTVSGAQQLSGQGGLGYPNGANGGLLLDRAKMVDFTTGSVSTYVGWFRGLWIPAHAGSNFVDGDLFSGTGDLAGRSFRVVRGLGGATSHAIVLEVSATVED